VACGGPQGSPSLETTPPSVVEPPPDPSEAQPYRLLEPSDRLLRASMVLRGIRPSPDDLRAVKADPSVLPDLIDRYLDDPLLGARMKDFAAELLLLRWDVVEPLPAIGPLEGFNLGEMYEATSESPLRLFEEIVVEDLPLTTIVTADWIWTNSAHSKIYGVPYDETSPERWQRSAWSDGRPSAGVLSDSEMWRRFESAGSNFQRLRANFIASSLLCEPFDARDISGASGVDISDEAEVANAVMLTPACVGCHQGLDPLADYFWGFKKQTKRSTVLKGYGNACRNYNVSGEPLIDTYVPSQYCYPLEIYTPADEDNWADWGLRPPSYFGHPARDLVDVGQLIAQDPRFSLCMARTFYAWSTQIERGQVPLEVAAELQRTLEESNFSTKQLLKAIVLSDSFQALSAEGSEVVPAAGLQTIRPEQFAATVEDLTGFRWWAVADLPGCEDGKLAGEGTICWGPVDLGVSDLFGFRAMSGGINGYYITAPTHTPTPPKDLVMERYATEAAAWVVQRDLQGVNLPPKLLKSVHAETVEEASVRAQLVDLHLRILGEWAEAEDPAIDMSYELFDGVRARGGTTEDAWTTVIAALLQDARMIFF
jgi:hypothetical protein